MWHSMFLALSRITIRCLARMRDQTLWTKGQTAQDPAEKRIQSCSHWMKVNLLDKDLLMIGFWTGSGYLNGVLANAIVT